MMEIAQRTKWPKHDENERKVSRVFFIAKKDRADYKRSGRWFSKAVPFNHGISLVEDENHLISQLLNELTEGETGRKILAQKKSDLAILLANLNQNDHCISVSMWNNNWTSSMYRKAGVYTKEAITKLHIKGYIDMKEAFKYPHNSRLTRIWATDKLLNYLMPLPKNTIYQPVSVVELKTWDSVKMTHPNSKRKKPKKIYELTEFKYEDHPKVWEIRSILENVNTVNNEAQITCEGIKLNVSLVAIFIDDFNKYGRLHARGYYNYQQLPKDKRKEILINGESVVECDFSGLLPNLLYAKEKIQYPITKDPYTCIDIPLEVRPFSKHVLLCMINSETENWAEHGANSWLFDSEREENELENLHKLGVFRAKPLMDAFKEAHKPIAKYFGNGDKTGMRIMNKDSKIAINILNHFTKKGIPILSVHDSFIVQKKYGGELYQIMKDVYKKNTKGFDIKVKIE